MIGGAREWTVFLLKCALAAALCGLVAWEANHLAEGLTASRFLRALGLAAAVGLGAVTYFVAARLLGLHESGEAWRTLTRRFSRRARAA